MAEAARKTKKRKVLSEETKKRKREATRIKGQSRINIGQAFTRWRELKDEEGFPTDAALALFLLDYYEKNPSAFKLLKRRRKSPPPQRVSTVVSESLNDRDHSPTDEEEASDAAFNHKIQSNSSTGSSSGNTEPLHMKDIISAVIVKSEDDGEKPVTRLIEVNIKEEPQTCSSADVIKKEPVTQLTEVNIKEEPQTCSSADVIKKEPVTPLTEVNIKEEPQTCSSADVIKKEEHKDNDEQQTGTS